MKFWIMKAYSRTTQICSLFLYYSSLAGSVEGRTHCLMPPGMGQWSVRLSHIRTCSDIQHII